MIIFDLDNTLFNTSLLKEDFKKIFEKYGIRGQEFWKTFYQAYDINSASKGCYSIDKHLSVLENFDKEKKGKLKKDLEMAMNQRGHEYLYPDVFPVLDQLKQRNIKFILITKGDKNFQELKLQATGLKDYFFKIYVVEGEKIPVLKKVVNNEKFININDHIKELEYTNNNFSKVSCVFMRRHAQNKPEGLDIPAVSNLHDLSWYLRTIQ